MFFSESIGIFILFCDFMMNGWGFFGFLYFESSRGFSWDIVGYFVMMKYIGGF